ncbi:ABC transporter ATP-binding protein [Actinoplanes sp. NPDC049265]|uniref:ABC transporter ATP-binding protein n=1 Tax=Actinoplanes sp. NPDC049265 TaxID=3363902 RepID=UPI00371905CE
MQPDDDDESELSLPYWLTSTSEAASTGFLAMLRRLPKLLLAAWRIAWEASPRTTAAVIVLQVLSGVVSAIGLISVVGVFDGLLREGATPERVRAAAPSLALLVAALAVRGILTSAAASANGRLTPRVFQTAEMRLLTVTTQVELTTFDDPEWRDAMQRARDRGISAAEQVVNQAIEVLNNVVGLIAAAGVLAALHPVLLPLLVLAVLPVGWSSARGARLRYRSLLKMIAMWRRQHMLAHLLAAREPAPELRAFTLQGFLLDEVRRLLELATRREVALSDTVVRTTMIGNALSGLITGLTYGVLLWLLWSGELALAAGGAAAYAINVGIGKLSELAFSANRVFEQGLYFADFDGFCEMSRARAEKPRSPHAFPFDSPPDSSVDSPGDSSGDSPLGSSGGSSGGSSVDSSGGSSLDFEEITLSDVTFTYPDADRAAVKDVSLTVRRGEIIALVGENGSGKSTLAALMAGLYQPQSGTVRWDGADLREFPPDAIRDRVAVVMQEPTRWPLSARLNITIGRYDRDVETDLVHSAARAGDAHDFVMELTRQYDTLLSRHFTGGADLSGGQWQRLAVSRAFYRDAPLLICDEPTANLDARAEHAVYLRLRELAAGRTVILITHRMASVREADRIFVLDHGSVVEEGDHPTLMSRGGIYAQLFTLQASAYQSA